MSKATIEDMRNKIEEMREKLKRDRLARGVPVDPPAKFVPLEMTLALIKRCKPIERAILEYAKLCNSSNEILLVSDKLAEWLRSYVIDLNLIRQSTDSMYVGYGTGISIAVATMLADEDSDVKSSASIYIRKIFTGLQIATNTVEVIRVDPGEVNEEEYDGLIKHYDSIKHEL